MGIDGLHHLVVRVEDAPEAQHFYEELFDMSLLFREGVLEGDVGTLPAGRSWAEARAAGVTPTMAFLNRDAFSLAVAAAGADRDAAHVADAPGRLDHVALAVDENTFEGITGRAVDLDCEVARNAPHHRVVTDPFGFEWELNARSRPPSQAFEPLDI